MAFDDIVVTLLGPPRPAIGLKFVAIFGAPQFLHVIGELRPFFVEATTLFVQTTQFGLTPFIEG